MPLQYGDIQGLEAWRAAQRLLQERGSDAKRVAVAKAASLLRQRDADGFKKWEAIAKTLIRMEALSMANGGQAKRVED